jgi:hypothetical protein
MSISHSSDCLNAVVARLRADQPLLPPALNRDDRRRESPRLMRRFLSHHFHCGLQVVISERFCRNFFIWKYALSL